jgi:hypothetical protein
MRRTATYIGWSAALALLVCAVSPAHADPVLRVTKVQVWDCRGSLKTCKLANGAPLPFTVPTAVKTHKKTKKVAPLVLGAR